MERYIIMGLIVYSFVVTGLILMKNGYILRASKLKLPFFEAEVSHLNDLSVVKMFHNVSRSLTAVGHAQRLVRLKERPDVMAHLGWGFVCGAYIYEYKHFPTDESLHSNAPELGVQNIEFIKVYRDLYQALLKNEKLTSKIAEEYFVRAPSLATRISKEFDARSDFHFAEILSNFDRSESSSKPRLKSLVMEEKIMKL